MNQQGMRAFPPLPSLLNTLDDVLADGEIDLLLRLGTELHSYEHALAVSGLNAGEFGAMFESLRQKGFIGTKYSETGGERYSLQPIVVARFEAQTSFLIGKPEEKEFAIYNPPIELQTKFAQIVEKTEALKAQYNQSLRELENLHGSLSQRAFRGEKNYKQKKTLTA